MIIWPLYFSLFKEEDEKERLNQVKELQEDDVGDNTEPLEDLFLGLSVEEVLASRKMITPSGRTKQAVSVWHHIVFPLSNVILRLATWHLHSSPSAFCCQRLNTDAAGTGQKCFVV